MTTQKKSLLITNDSMTLDFRRDKNRQRKLRMAGNGDGELIWDNNGWQRQVPQHVAANAIQTFEDYMANASPRDNIPITVGMVHFSECEDLQEASTPLQPEQRGDDLEQHSTAGSGSEGDTGESPS